MVAFEADLVIQNANGSPIAVVEVKNQLDFSRDVATEMHRNMMERGLPGSIPYFLLLSQDKGYLWKNPDDGIQDVPPTYEFPMDKVISRYGGKDAERRLYREVLEFLVLQWLTRLTGSESKSNEEPEQTLALSGFSDSIKGATVLFGKAG